MSKQRIWVRQNQPMEVAPQKRYREPGFPTRAILDAHPELLRLVPRRWRGNRVVLTALAIACVIVTGCRSAGSSKPARPRAAGAAVSRVAPIFLHGVGRGAFGCVAVNPPVFLSEDEARQVVVEEAKKAGISFEADLTTREVAVPVTDPYYRDRSLAYRLLHPAMRTTPLTFDGTDGKRKISYEFVSGADFEAWERKGIKPTSSVSEEDVLSSAEALRESIASAKPAGTYAVFYEPACSASWPVNWNTRKQEAIKLAREELRRQVRDFISWLKAQGVI